MAPPLAVCKHLADVLEYPGPELWPHVEACVSALEPLDLEAAEHIRTFRQSAGKMSSTEVEEAYTSAFDLQPDGCLYVGHHLFGENCRRNLFLSMLKEHYRTRGFSCGGELPDYLPAMLRFAAAHESDSETEELISECVVPALRSMAKRDGLYALPLRAALCFLTREAV